jgi:hypothetical protein
MRYFLLSSLSLALLVLVSEPARGVEFTSSLESIKISGRPGETVNRSFQLHLSPRGERVHFRARVEDWWQSEDGAQSFYRPPGTLPRSCGPWISLNPVETAVDPGGTLDIRVTAAIPAGAGPGGYWCVLTVDQLPDPSAQIQGVAIRFLSSVSVGIFITLEPAHRAAEIRDVSLEKGEVRARVRNLGDVPLGVEGRVEFQPPGGGSPVAIAEIARVTVLTAPAESRLVSARLPDSSVLPAGRYRLVILLDIGVEHYLGVQKELELSHEMRPPRPRP